MKHIKRDSWGIDYEDIKEKETLGGSFAYSCTQYYSAHTLDCDSLHAYARRTHTQCHVRTLVHTQKLQKNGRQAFNLSVYEQPTVRSTHALIVVLATA